ncbi:MAG: PEGA domain-containing protein [Methanoregula sp.]|jgi:PKD repeat protein
MNQNQIRTLTTVLYLYACSIVLVLAVTAAPVTTTTAIPHAGCDFPQTPHAALSMVTSDDDSPVTYQFTDQSTTISGQPITSWKWNFGDGATSTEKNPRHTYAASNTKANLGASLTVTTACGKSDTAQVTFKVQCTMPNAGFTTDVSSGFAPLPVKITDTSTHTPESITVWTYDVSSDTGFSGSAVTPDPDQMFTLLNPGNYTITQRVTKNCNINSATYRKDIRVSTLQLLYMATTTTATSSTTPTTSATTMVTTATSTTPPVTTTTVPVSTVKTTALSTVPATLSGGTTTIAPSAAAQSAQAAPDTGTLSVTTDPTGAIVYVDDVMWGASPATVSGLSSGAHSLRLEHAGYQNMSVPVTITEGKTAEFSLVLVPLPDNGSSSTGMLLLVAGAVVVLALIGAGAYLYMQKKKAP